MSDWYVARREFHPKTGKFSGSRREFDRLIMSDNRRMTFGFFWVSKAEGHACQIKALMANSLNRCTLQFLREPHHSHSMPTDDRLPTRERASSDPDFYVVLRMKGAAFSWEKTAWPVEIREDDMAPIYKILTIFFILCTTSDLHCE